MRRFMGHLAMGLLVVGMGIAAVTSAASAGIGGTATATPPVQGNSPTHNMFMYVDTVQGFGGSPAPAVGCSMTNEFIQGQVVVFRLFGVEIPTGGSNLTGATVKSATVTIPGVTAPIPFVWGSHGTVSYWTAAWPTADYSNLGIVDFVVTVITNPMPANSVHGAIPSLTGKFSQRGMPAPSQLTINPAA